MDSGLVSKVNVEESETSICQTSEKPVIKALPPGVSGFSRCACMNVKCRNYGSLRCSYNDNCRACYCSKKCEDDYHKWAQHICGPWDEKKTQAKQLDDIKFDETTSQAENLEQLKFDLKDDLAQIKKIVGVCSVDVEEGSGEVIVEEPMTRYAIYIRVTEDGDLGFRGRELCVIKGVPVFISVKRGQTGTFGSGSLVTDREANSCTYAVGFDRKTEKSIVASKFDLDLYDKFQQHGLAKYYETTRELGYGYKDILSFAYNSVLEDKLGTVETGDFDKLVRLSLEIKPERDWMIKHGLSTTIRDNNVMRLSISGDARTYGQTHQTRPPTRHTSHHTSSKRHSVQHTTDRNPRQSSRFKSTRQRSPQTKTSSPQTKKCSRYRSPVSTHHRSSSRKSSSQRSHKSSSKHTSKSKSSSNRSSKSIKSSSRKHQKRRKKRSRSKSGSRSHSRATKRFRSGSRSRSRSRRQHCKNVVA